MAAISSLRALAATALPLLTIAAAQVQAAAIDAEAVREALMKNTGLKAESVAVADSWTLGGLYSGSAFLCRRQSGLCLFGIDY